MDITSDHVVFAIIIAIGFFCLGVVVGTILPKFSDGESVKKDCCHDDVC